MTNIVTCPAREKGVDDVADFLADHLPANGQRALQCNAPWSSDVSPTDWSRGLPPSAPTITVTNIVTCPAREKSVDDVAVFLADHLPANGQRALQRNAPWSSDVSPTDWSRGLPPSAPTITVTNIVTCPAREKSVDDVAVFLADHLPANGQRALQRNAPWSSDVSPTDWSRGLPPSAPIENDDEPTADGSHDSPRRIERCPSMALQPRRHRAFAVDGVERQTTSTICTEEVASQTTRAYACKWSPGLCAAKTRLLPTLPQQATSWRNGRRICPRPFAAPLLVAVFTIH
mgnify:CR=1 FL=1